jgi:hypothetical protein
MGGRPAHALRELAAKELNMGRRLLVHSVHFTTEDVPTKTADGHDLMAPMPVAIIEMICHDGVRSSITHVERVPKKEDVDRVNATFPIGGTVEMGEFTLVIASEPAAESQAPAAA